MAADNRKLRDEALKASSKGNWKKAVEVYAELEQREPKDASWALRSGEAYRRLGKPADAVKAFGRALEIYSSSGLLLKAIAACKNILEIDPSQTDAQARLAALHSARGVPMTTEGKLAASRSGSANPAVTAAPPPARPAAATSSAVAVGPPAVSTPAVSVPSAAPLPPADLPHDAAISRERLSALMPAQVGGHAVKGSPAEADVFEFELGGDEVVEVWAETATAADTLRAALPKTPLFSALSERHLGMLIERVQLVHLEADETLFQRGDSGEALFVVASGEIAILAPHEVARLRDGEFFGEVSLMADQPRGATAQATCPTDVLSIDRATMAALIEDSPTVWSVLLRFLRDRLVARLIATNPLFQPFEASERAQLAARFRFLQIKPNVALVEQGTRSSGLYVLLAGGAQVEIGKRPLKFLGPGDVFGEISLLTNGPATATVRSVTMSFALELPRADFSEVILTHPQVLLYLDSLADTRRKEIGRLSLI